MISLVGDITSGVPVISPIGDIMGRFAVISSFPAITGDPMISPRAVISWAGAEISPPMSTTNALVILSDVSYPGFTHAAQSDT